MKDPTKRKMPTGFVWRNVSLERAVEMLLEEYGANAVQRARQGKAAGRRQRSRTIYGYWAGVEKQLEERMVNEDAADFTDDARQTQH